MLEIHGSNMNSQELIELDDRGQLCLLLQRIDELRVAVLVKSKILSDFTGFSRYWNYSECTCWSRSIEHIELYLERCLVDLERS
jgi:hypothetical protein